MSRSIEFDTIVQAVERLCIAACHELPGDVINALKEAAGKESNPKAAMVLRQLVKNAEIAENEQIPLCQDTGLAVVFVELGSEVVIEAKGRTLFDAINDGVKAGYENGFLRKGVVADPLRMGINTGTNTPAIIHCELVPGDKLKITLMAKGGGCENKSQFRMFKPTDDKGEIVDWIVGVVKTAGADACPPLIVGVGIGGNFEYSCLLSKKALLRNIGSTNKDSYYTALERQLLEKINLLGIGPQGFGGDTTALACFIETAPCHIASLPVAVNIDCHSHRHKETVI